MMGESCLTQVISRSLPLRDPDTDPLTSTETFVPVPGDTLLLHRGSAESAETGSLLVPMIAHALDEISSSEEGEETCELFEDNFDKTVDYDEDWIRELDAALSGEPVVRVPRADLAPHDQQVVAFDPLAPLVPLSAGTSSAWSGLDDVPSPPSSPTTLRGRGPSSSGANKMPQAQDGCHSGPDGGNGDRRERTQLRSSSAPRSASPPRPKNPLLTRGNAVEIFGRFGPLRGTTPKLRD